MKKPTPLLIIMALFGVSFVGRAASIANASISKTETSEEKSESLLAATDPGAPVNIAPKHATAAPDETTGKAHENETSAFAEAEEKNLSAAEKATRNASLLAAIRDRSAQLDQKERKIEDRIRTLEVIENRIDEKLAELKKNNQELSALVSFANEAAEKDIALLAKMYEQMKPQKAGEIFDKMNPEYAAGFLTEMSTDSAALILANMNTDKAYETSMIIAGRNAAVFQ